MGTRGVRVAGSRTSELPDSSDEPAAATAAACGRARDGRRKSTAHDPLHDVVVCLDDRRLGHVERMHEERLGAPLQLALRERPQDVRLHPSGERLRDARQQHDVRRTGQQEPPRAPVAVDARLHPRAGVPAPLHLVDDDRWAEAGDEPVRIGGCCGERDAVVEGEVRAERSIIKEALRQRALACLTRPDEQRHGRVGE